MFVLETPINPPPFIGIKTRYLMYLVDCSDRWVSLTIFTSGRIKSQGQSREQPNCIYFIPTQRLYLDILDNL